MIRAGVLSFETDSRAGVQVCRTPRAGRSKGETLIQTSTNKVSSRTHTVRSCNTCQQLSPYYPVSVLHQTLLRRKEVAACQAHLPSGCQPNRILPRHEVANTAVARQLQCIRPAVAVLYCTAGTCVMSPLQAVMINTATAVTVAVWHQRLDLPVERRSHAQD
jgi:hypothetical protein